MADPDPQQFTDLVNEVLKLTGLTQADLARKAGIGSQGTVSKWRSGTHMPHMGQWRKFVTFALKHPKTRHLFTDQLSLLLHDRDTKTKQDALDLLEIFLRDRP